MASTKPPLLDIFRGIYGRGDVTWVESVEGLDDATARMHEIAAKCPGPYFLFDLLTRSVLGEIDTSKHPETLLCL